MPHFCSCLLAWMYTFSIQTERGANHGITWQLLNGRGTSFITSMWIVHGTLLNLIKSLLLFHVNGMLHSNTINRTAGRACQIYVAIKCIHELFV